MRPSDFRQADFKRRVVAQAFEMRGYPMPIIVQLSSTALIAPIVHDLCAAGGNPAGAINRALHAYLYERFSSALAHRLIKPVKIRPEPGPSSGGPATLPALSKSGCEYWYIEVGFVTHLEAVIDELQVIGDDLLQVIPIDYDFGIHRAVQLKTVKKKRQSNQVLKLQSLPTQNHRLKAWQNGKRPCMDPSVKTILSRV